GGKLDFVQLAMDSFGNALGNNIVDRMTPTTSAPPVTLAKGGQRAMDLDGVNFLDAGIDTSLPDMRWMDDLNASIAAGSNIAVNANTPGHTAMVQSASQVAVAGGYVDSQNAGLTLEITYNANERTLPETVVTASATEKGGGLLNWLSKPENISFVLDMSPGIGSMKSIYQVFSGKDMITGEPINRWVEGAGTLASLVPGGKLGVKRILGAIPNNPTSQVIINKQAGTAREALVTRELQDLYPTASIQREQLLRTADGVKAVDPFTGTGRRIDHVVIQNGRALDSVETTSQTATKAAQIAKENRIRQQGGTFVRDRGTGQLIDLKDVPTQIIRKN
ncbi:MAG: pre-toxin TG domain-containing protein, partial [Moraxellaceae bacterium]|nr:pre-toxin TG domain-containing protein [Moraxellaceae bacterium]